LRMGFTKTFWAPKYEVLIGSHLLLRGLRLLNGINPLNGPI
jgi:hypothetical protein